MKGSKFFAAVWVALPVLAWAQDPATAPPATAQPQEVELPYIPLFGGNIGFGNLLSERTRDTFGSSGISLAPGLGPVFTRRGLSIAPGFNFFHASQDVDGERNKIFLVSVGPTFRYGFIRPITATKNGDDTVFHFKTFAPFAEAGVSLVYGDISVHSEGISNKTLTFGGNLAVGTTLGKNAFIKATFRFLPLVDSYDFNRYGIELGLRF